jgi:hypothetical protein
MQRQHLRDWRPGGFECLDRKARHCSTACRWSFVSERIGLPAEIGEHTIDGKLSTPLVHPALGTEDPT